MIHETAFIHPKAHVEDSEVGARTKVWQFASITRGARLGEDCSVAPGAMLDGCKFGDRVLIGPQVSMGPGFVVGDDVFIGPSVTFCNDAWPKVDKTGFRGDRLRSGELVTIRVGNRVSIGANVVILPGVTIGDDSFVAAGVVVDRNVPAGAIMMRDGSMREINPAWARLRMRAA